MKKVIALVATVLFLLASVVLSAVVEMIPLTYKYVIVAVLVAVFYTVVLKTLDEYKTTREKDDVYN